MTQLPALSSRSLDISILRSFALRAGPLAAVLVVAALLRLVNLVAVGFNSDEAVYASQAAGIAGEPALSSIFPVFRAHPLLVQSVLGVVFAFAGAGEATGRLVSVAWGLAAIAATFWVGRSLYGSRTGLLAASLLAIMPYHVIVTRQVLLDGPMTFLATVTLGLVAGHATTARPRWLVAAGAVLGLTVLAKEIAILFVGAIFVFLALSPEIRVRVSSLGAATAAFFLVLLAFPLAIVLSGGPASSPGQYVIWQFLRPANHDPLFYATVVPPAVGPLVIGAAVLGVWRVRRRIGWRERLLLVWTVVPIAFFFLWPTKGFQYLLPVAPGVCILAAQAFSASSITTRLQRVRMIALAAVLLSLLIPSLAVAVGTPSERPLAGAGGVPGGREAGLWVREHVGEDARLMTIGPSMGNILQFYGHRPTQALAVSPNQLRRNPAYTPIRNPDLALREGRFRFLVWDEVSAGRSPHFAGRLLEYARRYEARLVATLPSPERPLIRIYEIPRSAPPAPSEPMPVIARPSRPGFIIPVYAAAILFATLTAAWALSGGRIPYLRSREVTAEAATIQGGRSE